MGSFVTWKLQGRKLRDLTFCLLRQFEKIRNNFESWVTYKVFTVFRNQSHVSLLAPKHCVLYTWDNPTAERTLMWNVYNRKRPSYPAFISKVHSVTQHASVSTLGYPAFFSKVHSVTQHASPRYTQLPSIHLQGTPSYPAFISKVHSVTQHASVSTPSYPAFISKVHPVTQHSSPRYTQLPNTHLRNTFSSPYSHNNSVCVFYIMYVRYT